MDVGEYSGPQSEENISMSTVESEPTTRDDVAANWSIFQFIIYTVFVFITGMTWGAVLERIFG